MMFLSAKRRVEKTHDAPEKSETTQKRRFHDERSRPLDVEHTIYHFRISLEIH